MIRFVYLSSYRPLCANIERNYKGCIVTDKDIDYRLLFSHNMELRDSADNLFEVNPTEYDYNNYRIGDTIGKPHDNPYKF